MIPKKTMTTEESTDALQSSLVVLRVLFLLAFLRGIGLIDMISLS